MLVYDEEVPRHFWRIATTTVVLPSRDSEIKGVIVRITKVNAVLKRPVNKLFPIENTYDNNETDKTRKQKLTCEEAAIGELKRKCES